MHPRRWTCGVLIALLLVLALPVTAQGNTETFANDWFSFEHPIGWVVIDQDVAVTLGTNARAAEVGADLLPGDMRATIWVGSMTDPPFSLPVDTALPDVLRTIVEGVPGPETCDDFGPAQRIGRSALVFARQSCSRRDNISIVRAMGDGMLFVVAGTTPRNEMDAMQATLLNVALSAQLFDAPPPAAGAPLDESNNIRVNPDTLAHEFVSEDGKVTFRYPDGWRANEDEAYVFGITDGPQPSLPDIPGDQNHLILAVFTPEEIPSYVRTVEDFLLDFTQDDSNSVLFEDPVLFQLNGRPAAYSVADVPILDAVMMAVEIGDGYVLLYGLLDEGMFEDEQKMIYTVLGSITYEPFAQMDIELPETHYEQTPFAFDYPAGWDTIVIPGTTGGPTVFLTSPEYGLLIINVWEGTSIDALAAEAYDLGVMEGERTPIQTDFEIDGRAGIRVEADDADEGFSNVTFLLEMPGGRVASLKLSIITPWIDDYEPYAMAVLPTIRWNE